MCIRDSTIAEMENFSVSIDGNVEEWSPMEQEGWLKRMVTGKMCIRDRLSPSRDAETVRMVVNRYFKENNSYR